MVAIFFWRSGIWIRPTTEFFCFTDKNVMGEGLLVFFNIYERYLLSAAVIGRLFILFQNRHGRAQGKDMDRQI